MELEDALDEVLTPEIGVAAAAAAILLSPPVRGLLRRGAKYGLAAFLSAGDAIAAMTRGANHAGQPDASSEMAHELAREARRERAQRAETAAQPDQAEQAERELMPEGTPANL